MAASGVKPMADGCAIEIKVTPRASRLAIEPARDGRLLVRVTAAPADGEANAAVFKLLAKSLKLPKTSMEITSGTTAREKTVAVHGVDAPEVERRLASYFEKQ